MNTHILQQPENTECISSLIREKPVTEIVNTAVLQPFYPSYLETQSAATALTKVTISTLKISSQPVCGLVCHAL